jgi:DNA polymerase-3 subunit alpha
MCALLTCEKDNTDKVVEYVQASEAIGITILPPDVNESLTEFRVIDDKTIRFGLLAVKNVGQTAIESIVENRQKDGPYLSLYDFCKRVDRRLANRKVVESLIKCGAFDQFKVYRSQLMAIIDKALDAGTRAQKEQASGQFSFFSMGDELGGFTKETEVFPDIKEWPQPEILSYEKEMLGFYLSGHPLNHYQTEIKEFVDYTTRDLKQAVEGQEVKLIGIINAVKLTTTRKSNERMAIIKLQDMEGEVESVVFPSTYQSVADVLKEGEIVVVVGRVGFREDVPNIVAGDIKKIEEIYKAITSINLNVSDVTQNDLTRLREKLSLFPGKIPVYLHLNTKEYKSVQILVGEDLFVTPNGDLINQIKDIVGSDRFSVTM